MTNEITTMEQIMEENTDKMIAAFTQKGGMDYLLQDVDEAVDCFNHDMGTKASRARTATLANKVVKVKSKVDSVRKELTAARRDEIKKIDGFGKVARDHLMATKIRARKPLTDWEDAEQKRVDELEKQISAITSLGETTDQETGVPLDLDVLKANLEALDAVEVTEEVFGDKELDAFKVKKFGIDLVANAIAREEGRIAQEEELNRLRAAEADRVAKEMEDKRIAKEEEAKRLDEEFKKKRIAKEKEDELNRLALQKEHDREVAEEAKREAEEAAEQAKIDATNAKKAEEEAEQRRIDAEMQAEFDRKEAKKVAEKEQDEAVQRAKDEAQREQDREREELARLQREREENQKYVDEVITRAVAALMDYTNLHAEDATDVISEIRKGRIPNVSIRF